MKRYMIKSEPGKMEYLDILEETDEGYKVRITRIVDGDERILEELLTRHLFNICVKTGFLSESSGNAISVA